MANEIIKRDDNRVTVLAGITDDSAQEIRNLLIDPATGRLKVSAVLSSGTGDVVGPASSVDGVVALFSGTTGKLLKSGLALFPYAIAGNLALADTNSSNYLGIKMGSDLSADRLLTLITGDASRSLTLSGNADISGTNTGDQALASTAEINAGTDSTKIITTDKFVASNRNVRYLDFYLIDSATDLTTGTGKGGNFECPFTGTITAVGAYVNTAGTTNASVFDIHLNGTTIMTTNKLSIDSAEVSTRTAATAPTLTTSAITAGDLISFDIDSLSTTAPKGLHVRMEIRLT